jgi:AGCS family alanine or glycine:cation symporter
LPAFQANQLTQTLVDVFEVREANIDTAKLLLGISIAIITAMVIFGGIKRIGNISHIRKSEREERMRIL